jgi:hypothetical protein
VKNPAQFRGVGTRSEGLSFGDSIRTSAVASPYESESSDHVSESKQSFAH